MIKKLILWVLVIGCMVMIFSFSAQPAEDSQELSDSMLDEILRIFMVNASDETIAFLSVFIRKVAHFAVYALLGGMMFLAIRAHGVKDKRMVLAPWLLSALYAITDEVHQLMVPGRSGQIKDVCIDSLGAITGILIVWATVSLFTRRRK